MHSILADFFWPDLFFQQRLFSLWAIGLGLVIELFFVRWLTGLSWRMSIVADIAMNAASSTVGLLAIMFVGTAWEFCLGSPSPAAWTGTFLLATFISAGIETAVLRYGFEQKAVKRLFWWLVLANALSGGLALASLFIYPPHTP